MSAVLHNPHFDLIVVGMGSAGTIAAELAADDLGLRVAAIERSRVGGDCLWTGCVPSKAVIASARVGHLVGRAGDYGVQLEPATVDPAQVWASMKAIRDEIASTDDDPDRFRNLGVALYEGDATVVDPHHVSVGDHVLSTRYVLVCTGSRPRVPDVPGLTGEAVLTTDELFELDTPPASVIILGGGAVGCELGQALSRLGRSVSIVDVAPTLLPGVEPELTSLLHRQLIGEGVELHLAVGAAHAEPTARGVALSLTDGTVLRAERVLVATGRAPNVEGLGLAELGVDVGHEGVATDERGRTSVRSIYAVGDVSRRPSFTHTAAYDAGTAITDMFFPIRGRVGAVVPRCVFTDPEIAQVGVTEAEAVARHGDARVEVWRRDLADSDRARTDRVHNAAAIVVTARGRVVGAHIAAPHASEMIHEYALAIDQGLKLSDLSRLIHAYPTFATGLGQLASEPLRAQARRLSAVAKVGRMSRWWRRVSGRSTHRPR